MPAACLTTRSAVLDGEARRDATVCSSLTDASVRNEWPVVGVSEVMTHALQHQKSTGKTLPSQTRAWANAGDPAVSKYGYDGARTILGHDLLLEIVDAVDGKKVIPINSRLSQI